jgi:hypothetical protein
MDFIKSTLNFNNKERQSSFHFNEKEVEGRRFDSTQIRWSSGDCRERGKQD